MESAAGPADGREVTDAARDGFSGRSYLVEFAERVMPLPDEKQVANALSLAEKVFNATTDLMARATRPTDVLGTTQVDLVRTIRDGLHGVIVLVPSRAQGHAHTVARSMIESTGDLYHLVADPRYGGRLALTSARKMKKAAARSIDHFQRYGGGTPEAIERAKTTLKRAIEATKSFEGMGFKQLTVEERVQAPGLPFPLITFYDELSFHAHQGIRVLGARFYPDGIRNFDGSLGAAGKIEVLSLSSMVMCLAIDVLSRIWIFDEMFYKSKWNEAHEASLRLSLMLYIARH